MKKFKDIKAIKTNPEPAKGKNVDPDQLGQYSAKYQVSESTASLNRYLSARGINPQFVSTATKIAHAKSAQFLKWKQDHMQRREEVQLEASKASKPTALERFRAAAAVREKKHNGIEKERQERLHQEPSKSNVPDRETKKDYMSAAIDRLEKHLNNEEVELDEMINEVLGKDASAGDWIHDFVHSKNPKFAGKSTAERKKMALGAYYGKQNEENIEEDVKDILRAVRGSKELVHKVSVNGQVKTIHKNKDSAKSAATTIKSKFPHLKVTINSVHEDMWQDPQAATQTPADGANGGNQVADRKRQMSKSARMIKALYKRKGVVKEDMYDHEKEDKSVATYGKKPKMSQTDKNDSLGENKPQAAATLSGGTTLTGVKRDSIEIDPIMRNRPGQPNIDKKSGKKENNKNDK
jgi:hypothetical protein